jgi:hypothetical protein
VALLCSLWWRGKRLGVLVALAHARFQSGPVDHSDVASAGVNPTYTGAL